jgi:transcription antitermination factor NusG
MSFMSQEEGGNHSLSIQTKNWFAFRVRPRHEKTVALQLGEKEEHYFLPLIREKRKWANRLSNVDLPLFPGYIFCRASRSALLPILRTTGIIDVLRAGSHPLHVDEQEIHAVKKAVSANVDIEACPYIDSGQKVYVSDGPLTGLVGVVVNFRNARRLVLSMTLLHRSILAELDASSVIPCDSTPAVREFGHVA